jgi:hypothetical protein
MATRIEPLGPQYGIDLRHATFEADRITVSGPGLLDAEGCARIALGALKLEGLERGRRVSGSFFLYAFEALSRAG